MSAYTRPPWPPERYPTAEEWVDWFLANDRAGQEEIAAKVINDLADIHRCLRSAPGSCWIDR